MKGRKRNRLKGFDYSSEGGYFVTICTQNRKKWFGEIKNGKIELNEFGEIAKKQWLWLAQQYSYVKLDMFVIMPNHVHGIIIIQNNIVGNGRDRSLQNGRDRSPRKIKSLSELIGAFKTTSSKLIHIAGLNDFKWQKSFYDRIVRDERSFYYIQEYILNNPSKWPMDVENPENKNADLKNYYDKLYGKTDVVGTGHCPVPTENPGHCPKNNGQNSVGTGQCPVPTGYPVVLTYAFNPILFKDCLKDKTPEIISTLGNTDILSHKRTAFFCSSKCPGELILRAYDLMRELRDKGVTIIGGFHSPMEKECLRILLRGKQSLIVCLAKHLVKGRLPDEYRRAIDDNRLVLISPFTDKAKRVTAETAQFRNEFVATFADAVFVVHAAFGGKTEEFCRKVIDWGKPLFTFDSPENANLTAMGARTYEGERRKNEEGRTDVVASNQ